MRAFLCGLMALAAISGSADVVKTTSGNQIDCIVLQENQDSVVIQRGYGMMTYPRGRATSDRSLPAPDARRTVVPELAVRQSCFAVAYCAVGDTIEPGTVGRSGE